MQEVAKEIECATKKASNNYHEVQLKQQHSYSKFIMWLSTVRDVKIYREYKHGRIVYNGRYID